VQYYKGNSLTQKQHLVSLFWFGEKKSPL